METQTEPSFHGPEQYLRSKLSFSESLPNQLLTRLPLAHGRNLSLLRYPQFTRLVQVGLPNRLRGEIWETLSGSLYLRFANPGLYQKILDDNKDRTTASMDDIEKDLHRSLPEYSAYQSEVMPEHL